MLTDNERDVLECLIGHAESGRRSGAHDEWALPMDLGAWDASHHSHTLKRLCIRGFAQRKPRYYERIHTSEEVKTGRRIVDGQTRRLRGPYRYRVTPAGQKAAEEGKQ